METTEKITLGVVFGGASSEHEISCLSAASVLANLDPARYRVLPVGITKGGLWFVYTGEVQSVENGAWEQDAEHLLPCVISPCTATHGLFVLDKAAGTFRVEKLDCVFPVVHGENCEDGKLQGLLALSGIPFVGCDTLSSAVTMDKVTTKLLLSSYGIPQAKWTLVYRHELAAGEEKAIARVEAALPYPVFVKPSGTGSSFGVSRAANREELSRALGDAAQYDEKILIEEEICGSEVEVALLERVGEDGRKTLQASTPGEIVPDGEFYDYEAKYVKGTSRCLAPAGISASAAERVRMYAKQIFSALGCAGFSRADFFVSGEKIIFNEINTIPGFTAISMYPKLFGYDGIAYPELLNILVDSARNTGARA